MILALALMAQEATPTEVPSEAEIVVMARKMRMIEVDLKAPRRKGKMILKSCRVSKPSGVAELDAIPCEAAQECIAEAPATGRQLERCVEAKSQVRLDATIASWRARR